MSKVLTSSNKFLMSGGRWLTRESSGPSLPPYTIRLKFTEGVTPSFDIGTAVQVSSSPNIWDLTHEHWWWSALLYNQQSLIEVIDANTTGVSDMADMFRDCSSLISVPLFDTSSVTMMTGMFRDCSALTSVPLLDTSSVMDMTEMFRDCYNVETGALALYQQASTQATVPGHSGTFRNCGSNTVTGAAELAQIPSDWK